jgi:hypothetical protein
VLLTRSPLRHPTEEGASLDLHVLSTPPAFVLSQNQTLRECYKDTHPTKAEQDINHKKANHPKQGSQRLLTNPS